MRNINLKIDINKQNYIYEDAMQNDDITLQITLFENGTPYNLGTNTVTLNWLKADGTFVLINTTKEISITNNVVNIILPRDCTRAIGEVAFELSIKDTNGKQISTFPLSIEVIGSVLSGNKEPSKNLITSIEELENVIDNKINQADAKKTELDTSIANAQDDINTINSAGNRTFTIPSTAWVGTEPDLSYILEHNLGGVNLIVGVIDDDTKLSSMPDYKSIDSMSIELYSTTKRNVTVTINKSAYTGNDSEWVSQEVIDARDGEISLKGKIENINTSINALNTEIITARGSNLTLDERLDGIDLDVSEKQSKVDNTLNTTAKSVVGAINENTTLLIGKVNKTIQTFKPTLINGWVNYTSWNTNYGDLIFYKDDMGIVHIEGTLTGGTTAYPFVLPVGFRPSKNILATASALQGVDGSIIVPLQAVIEKDSGNFGLFGWNTSLSRVAINISFKLI